MGVLGNVGCLVITNVRIQRSHKHQRVIHKLINAFGIRLESSETVFHKRLAAVTNQAD